MAVLRPYLYSENAREQGAFYAKALKGEITGVQTFGEGPQGREEIKDKVMHLEVQAAGLKYYLADSVMEPVKQGNNIALNLEFPTEQEARAAFEGLSEGGQVLMKFERMFWGAMFGRLIDRYGVCWQVSTEM